MKVGILSLIHESNTFSATPTTMASFRRDSLLLGEEVRQEFEGGLNQISGFLEGLAAAAPPVPGPTSGHQFSLPCGEAYCLLTVREEGEGRALEVVYDFAL